MQNLRNFWIHTVVDDKMHPVATGPRNKDGGMCIILSIRDKGLVKVALRILCTASDTGALNIRVHNGEGKFLYAQETMR